jgi:hypothetical protein
MNVRTLLFASLSSAALALPAAAQSVQVWYEGPKDPLLTAGAEFGSSVAGLPGGQRNLLIGGPNYGADAGRVVLASIDSFVSQYSFTGDPGWRFGEVVAAGGFVNGDGFRDFAMSAPRKDHFALPFPLDEAGSVYVYSGLEPYTVIHELKGHEIGDRFGEAVVLDWDVDGDSRADIVVGAPYADLPGGLTDAGYAELYSGATGALIVRHEGEEAGDLYGFAVTYLGDMTGDHRSEYAIGVPGDDFFTAFPPAFVTDGGSVRVFDGATHALLYTAQGAADHELGTSLEGVGDIDDDNLRELIAGAPGASGDMGQARHYEGLSGTLIRTYSGPGATTGERFGIWVSDGGDHDKDGHAELAIGGLFGGSAQQHGFVRIFRGSDGTAWKTVYLAPGSKGGYAFAGGTDLNDDGWADLLVGRPAADINGTNSGYAEVWGFLHYQDDLGFKKGGGTLEVYGAELATGKQADLLLTGAGTNNQAFLLAGFSTAYMPFHGGTLVPSLSPSILLPLATDNFGKLFLPGIPGGSGTGGIVHAYVQFIINDPFGIVTLSNAVDLEFLP